MRRTCPRHKNSPSRLCWKSGTELEPERGKTLSGKSWLSGEFHCKSLAVFLKREAELDSALIRLFHHFTITCPHWSAGSSMYWTRAWRGVVEAFFLFSHSNADWSCSSFFLSTLTVRQSRKMTRVRIMAFETFALLHSAWRFYINSNNKAIKQCLMFFD